MKIIRNILGANIEIELTSDEIYQAYLKHEEICDIQDVKTHIDNCDVDEFFEKYNITTDRINNDTDLIYSIAIAKMTWIWKRRWKKRLKIV